MGRGQAYPAPAYALQCATLTQKIFILFLHHFKPYPMLRSSNLNQVTQLGVAALMRTSP